MVILMIFNFKNHKNHMILMTQHEKNPKETKSIQLKGSLQNGRIIAPAVFVTKLQRLLPIATVFINLNRKSYTHVYLDNT